MDPISEDEFVAREASINLRGYLADSESVKAAIEDAQADDFDGVFSEKLAAFFLAIEKANTERPAADAALDLWGWLKHSAVKPVLERRAKVDAQASWDRLHADAREGV